MTTLRIISTILALLAVTACGPGGLSFDPSSDDDGETDDDGNTGDGDGGSTSSSTDTGTSTDETTTTEPGTWSFVPEMDEWQVSNCDPFEQDCPDGEKCVPYGSTGGNWDASKCVPVTGEQAPGEPCTYGGTLEATDDCDQTSHCWDVQVVNGEPIGTCLPFCTGTAADPECPPGSACLDDLINLCIHTCDPILQDCAAGLACFWDNNGFNCIFTTQDIPSGEPCGFINDCAGGLVCLTPEVLPDCGGAACCSPFCHLDLGDAQCEVIPGTSCLPFFEQGTAPPGYEHVGVCIVL